MGKSIYSIVLNDDVVSKIDMLAYRAGTNRSGMINRILAEYVSYTTPEKRIQDIFEEIQNLLVGDTFQSLLQPSDSMYSLRSVIAYKYNPTLKYSIELYPEPKDGCFGELRVTVRTQNNTLISHLDRFFAIWSEIETSVKDAQLACASGRFLRKFQWQYESVPDANQIADAVASYIDTIDKAAKMYFDCLKNDINPLPLVKSIYADYIKEARTNHQII